MLNASVAASVTIFVRVCKGKLVAMRNDPAFSSNNETYAKQDVAASLISKFPINATKPEIIKPMKLPMYRTVGIIHWKQTLYPSSFGMGEQGLQITQDLHKQQQQYRKVKYNIHNRKRTTETTVPTIAGKARLPA
mmetsp:Transcript_9592/g.18022  ORF Transcript_9592/g.18022 Transcript_9592/m.18022 type:complete len:135 (-) Transcript_9592:2293-2697(-)